MRKKDKDYVILTDLGKKAAIQAKALKMTNWHAAEEKNLWNCEEKVTFGKVKIPVTGEVGYICNPKERSIAKQRVKDPKKKRKAIKTELERRKLSKSDSESKSKSESESDDFQPERKRHRA